MAKPEKILSPESGERKSFGDMFQEIMEKTNITKDVLADFASDRTNEWLRHYCRALAYQVIQSCSDREIKITTMESFTGGFLGSELTAVKKASTALRQTLTAYGTVNKQNAGVPVELIEMHTVYSTHVAEAMAKGALHFNDDPTDLAISTTGCTTKSDPKVSGSVAGKFYICVAGDEKLLNKTITKEYQSPGGVESPDFYKYCAAIRAFQLVLTFLGADEEKEYGPVEDGSDMAL